MSVKWQLCDRTKAQMVTYLMSYCYIFNSCLRSNLLVYRLFVRVKTVLLELLAYNMTACLDACCKNLDAKNTTLGGKPVGHSFGVLPALACTAFTHQAIWQHRTF